MAADVDGILAAPHHAPAVFGLFVKGLQHRHLPVTWPQEMHWQRFDIDGNDEQSRHGHERHNDFSPALVGDARKIGDGRLNDEPAQHHHAQHGREQKPGLFVADHHVREEERKGGPDNEMPPRHERTHEQSRKQEQAERALDVRRPVELKIPPPGRHAELRDLVFEDVDLEVAPRSEHPVAITPTIQEHAEADDSGEREAGL